MGVKRALAVAVTVFLVAVALGGGAARAGQARLETEFGALWQSRNDVRIPAGSGTTFSLSDFGSGPFFFYRLGLRYDFNERHAVRALFAPLEVEVSGTPAGAIDFAGGTFAAGLPVDGTYKFNSYRLAYLYNFDREGRWRLSAGFSAKIRDARVALRNAEGESEDTNIGFVPLLVFRAEADLGRATRLVIDVEALGAPQGRAEDIAVMIRHDLTCALDIGAGYRMLEGGADVEKVFTFAWLHYAVIAVGVKL